MFPRTHCRRGQAERNGPLNLFQGGVVYLKLAPLTGPNNGLLIWIIFYSGVSRRLNPSMCVFCTDLSNEHAMHLNILCGRMVFEVTAQSSHQEYLFLLLLKPSPHCHAFGSRDYNYLRKMRVAQHTYSRIPSRINVRPYEWWLPLCVFLSMQSIVSRMLVRLHFGTFCVLRRVSSFILLLFPGIGTWVFCSGNKCVLADAEGAF